LASGFEGFWNWGWCTIHEIADGLGLLKFLVSLQLEEFILEAFSKDLGELLGGLSQISLKDNWRVLKQEITKEFELNLCLFNIMGDWKLANPVANELRGHNRVLLDVSELVSNDLTKTGDCVVLSMVVQVLLLLLSLNLGAHWEFNSLLQ